MEPHNEAGCRSHIFIDLNGQLYLLHQSEVNRVPLHLSKANQSMIVHGCEYQRLTNPSNLAKRIQKGETQGLTRCGVSKLEDGAIIGRPRPN